MEPPKINLDVVLVAEGQRSAGASSVTPRYEPSWFYDEIDSSLVDSCLRPRRREPLDADSRDWLHKQLITCGHEANGRGHHFMAHAWFECAYQTKEDLSAFISSVNMRMRLGQITLAGRIYERLLQGKLTDAQRGVVERKLKEATHAKTSRAHSPTKPSAPQDEVAQLLHPVAAAEALGEPMERERLLKLLRRMGHAANEADEYEVAHLWFDCAFALMQSLSDLLSAANMRVKLVDTSPAAEVLYLHALTEVEIQPREQAMAERKLQQLQENQRKVAASVEYGEAFTSR